MLNNDVRIKEGGTAMGCLELMVEEHKNIKRLLSVVRKYCYRILRGERVDYEKFYTMTDFIKNYADRLHHGKEETILFNRMVEEIGPTAEKLIRHGMLVEHDLGRLHVQELEAAVGRVLAGDEEARLDVIAEAISYSHLLQRHIDKEDGVVYKFAGSKLKPDTLEKINNECRSFEEDSRTEEDKRKYLSLLEEMEAWV